MTPETDPATPEPASKVTDLMAALMDSVAKVKADRLARRRGRAETTREDTP